MNDNPRPPTKPTNGRPRPGDRIRVTRTGAEGRVLDYEWGWNSHIFPVRLDFSLIDQNITVADVTIITSTVVDIDWPQTPNTTISTETGTSTDTAPRAPRQRDEGAA